MFKNHFGRPHQTTKGGRGMKQIKSNSGTIYKKLKIKKNKFVYLDKFGNTPNPYDLNEWGGRKQEEKQ